MFEAINFPYIYFSFSTVFVTSVKMFIHFHCGFLFEPMVHLEAYFIISMHKGIFLVIPLLLRVSVTQWLGLLTWGHFFYPSCVILDKSLILNLNFKIQIIDIICYILSTDCRLSIDYR